MIRCTHFGELMADEGRAARKLALIETDSAHELETWPALPSRHFVCLVVWDAPKDDAIVLGFARALLDAGAIYVCTFGDGCERVHDAVDHFIVSTERETGDDDVILTTWHSSETFDQALWFALFTAYPAPAYAATCRSTVIVTVGPQRYTSSLHGDLADPEAFSRRVLGERG